ncbi:MAG TPA: glucose 1-dehydrogenase [Gaiellaceae bacterium]|jgi:NAD(P)-dependent dehydrogenase (short-subunit alcohol dehydrogenase family)
MRLADRVVIITGGGSGIGRVMAKEFADAGARVVVVDRMGDSADTVAREIGADETVIATKHDVTVAADVDAMVRAAEDAFGRVDVLVNNAAVCAGDDILRIDEATWDADVAGVLKSAFLCSKRVLPGMIERAHGTILNIASVNGLAYFGNEAYSAAKAGMINLTQSIAARYGAHGIRANAIAPASIRTPIWQHRVDAEPEIFEKLVKWYPLGRVGEPEDVAHAALFLASDEAAWISGAVLRVDGALTAGYPLMAEELLVESRER